MNEVLLQKANYLQPEELRLMKKAIQFAKQAHDGQYRQTGAPYIIHPFAITEILLHYKADATTLIAALLHDVVEDTDHSLEEVESHFGTTIRYIVDGLTKVNKQQNPEKALYEATNFKKLLLASQQDIRVSIIKVIDRLHNIKTLGIKKPAKQVAYANETLTFFAPLAKRLGLYDIQHELENLAFKHLHKERYENMRSFLNGYVKQIQQNIVELNRGINNFYDTNLSFELHYNFTPIYSAYSQLQEAQDISKVSQIYITTSSVLDCYTILGMIHQLYKPNIKSFEDNIALENNHFNSNLKTKITINDVEQVIIIQTRLAKRINNSGVFYLLNNFDNDIKKISYSILDDTIFNNHLLTKDPFIFHDLVSYELFENTITTYTTNLRPIYLPKGSTIIDFTFAAFPDKAHYMYSTKLNGNPVSINTELSHLDVVESYFNTKQNVSIDWLNYVHTAKAQLMIEQKLS
ncbi:HD domain-containing protein [Bacillus paramycoides]|uniref:HD domain-containing protein n=1 Tax=Bacillus paramycoides TaxID=2026194 RepID=UPI003D20DA44